MLDAIGSGNYIYVNFDTFVYFTLYTPWVYFFSVRLLYISTENDWLCHGVIVRYEFLFICSLILYMCLQWHDFLFYTIYLLVVIHPGVFLYLSYSWVIIRMCCCCIIFCINIFVYIISMFTVIFLCTLYDIIHGFNTYWGYFHLYLLYMIYYATYAILIDLNSQ